MATAGSHSSWYKSWYCVCRYHGCKEIPCHAQRATHGTKSPQVFDRKNKTPEKPALKNHGVRDRVRPARRSMYKKYIKLDINIKFCIIAIVKDVRFVGSSLDDLKHFPAGARREAGFELSNVQAGLQPSDWKPMNTVGAGAVEIRIKDTAGIYRVIYVARFEEAIYVLHAFQKKTRKTRKADIELAKARYKVLAEQRKQK